METATQTNQQLEYSNLQHLFDKEGSVGFFPPFFSVDIQHDLCSLTFNCTCQYHLCFCGIRKIQLFLSLNHLNDELVYRIC